MEKFGDIGRKKGSKGKGKNAEEQQEEEGESGEVRQYIGKECQHKILWR